MPENIDLPDPHQLAESLIGPDPNIAMEKERAFHESEKKKRNDARDDLRKRIETKINIGDRVFAVAVNPRCVRSDGGYDTGNGYEHTPALVYSVNGVNVAAEDFVALLAVARAEMASVDASQLIDHASNIHRDMRR